jgi:murein tripeptide amidase MpaA
MISSLLPLPGMGQPLPPELPWKGRSEKLVAGPKDAWVTPVELSGFTQTPDYPQTVSWLQKLADSSAHVTLQSIGKTDQNRDLWMVICSEKEADGPEKLDPKKATWLFHGGIHSGEIDGKDAGMMFLRDVVFKRASLLKNLNILFIPVLNADGHENKSAYNRVNQRGPAEIGWRTNARNLNLNRDYAKAESPEIRALLKIFNTWPVDFYMDIHVTDGLDYQYDITFGYNNHQPYSPAITAWLDKFHTPSANQALKQAGHIPGPLIGTLDKKFPQARLYDFRSTPRYSNGYGDARHVPAILVENHSLKGYKQRVLGTYVYLEATARALSQNAASLHKAIAADKALRPKSLAMGWEPDTLKAKPDTIQLSGVDYQMFDSPISGAPQERWLGKRRNLRFPYIYSKAKYAVGRPSAYWIPVERSDIIAKLRVHGIAMELAPETVKKKMQFYRLVAPVLATTPFEGRVRLTLGGLKADTLERVFHAGSARVSTDQPLGDLAMLLLEPQGEDSFLQWGFFHEILQRTEYIEGYVVEPLAQQMLETRPELRKEFAQALQDEAFAKNPEARLKWFFERSAYYDPNHLVYPVGREL